jgi:hypothetical protein
MAFGQYLGMVVGAIGAIVGAVIGTYVFPGVGTGAGAVWGFSIGSLIGGVAGEVFWPEKTGLNLPPPPRPHETRLQFSSWGMPIPIQYGSGRMAGNIIYMSDIVETVTRSRHRQDGVRYYEMTKTYTATFAISFCEGPIEGFARMWVNNKVFFDMRDTSSIYYPGDGAISLANIETSIARSAVFLRMYYGTEGQSCDPEIAALMTAAETPAYRGVCYIVFIDFPIGEFSGVPNIEVEVSKQWTLVEAYWKFEDLTDGSGNNHTLTNTNAVTFTAGNVGNAATFNGTNWLEIHSFPTTGTFTVDFFIKVASYPADHAYLFNRRNIANNANYAISILSNHKIRLASYLGSVPLAKAIDSDTLISLGIWYRITAVFNGVNSRIFFNRVIDKTGALDNLVCGSDLYIGSNVGINNFVGQMDEMYFITRALTDAEITG